MCFLMNGVVSSLPNGNRNLRTYEPQSKSALLRNTSSFLDPGDVDRDIGEKPC